MACRFGTATMLAALALVLTLDGTVSAQPLGTFNWQLAPYCNVITVSVAQDGAVYTLDGYDSQCGTAARAAVSGTAFLNPDGTVGIGLTTVTAPGGTAVHLEASIDAIALGGAWHDSHGNSGTLVFSPASPGGSPRPLGTGDIPDGSITSAKLADGAVTGAKIADGSIRAIDVNLTEVQRRISAACPADQMMTAVRIDGSVDCVTAAGTGDITAVTAGAGLSGGGASGAVMLAVDFQGPGSAFAAARSDHTHERPGNDHNVAVGPGALSRTTGPWNTGVGSAVLELNTSGTENTAFGANSLRLNTTGRTNTAIGASALASNTDGIGNLAVGVSALRDNDAGSNNTAVGNHALQNLETGGSNLAVGHMAGALLTDGVDNVYLASSGGTNSESGTTRIGRSNAQTRAFVAGIRGTTTGQANAVGVVIDSAGQLGTVSSSRRTKFDIASLDAPVTEALQRLRPVQFRYRQAFADGTTPLEYGLIAEEVQDVLPALVATGADGQPETVKYHVLPALLLSDVQRLERERLRLEKAFAREAARVAELERLVEAQGRAIDALRGGVSRSQPW